MEIRVCIHVKDQLGKSPCIVHTTINDDDLIDWAQQYVEDNFPPGNEVMGLDVESIVP